MTQLGMSRCEFGVYYSIRGWTKGNGPFGVNSVRLRNTRSKSHECYLSFEDLDRLPPLFTIFDPPIPLTIFELSIRSLSHLPCTRINDINQEGQYEIIYSTTRSGRCHSTSNRFSSQVSGSCQTSRNPPLLRKRPSLNSPLQQLRMILLPLSVRTRPVQCKHLMAAGPGFRSSAPLSSFA